MRNAKSCLAAVTMIALMGILSGCTGKRPFLIVQLCVGDEQGAELFISTLKSVARSRNMKFIDGSAENQEKLKSMEVSPKYKLIDVGIDGKNGIGLSAGNLGLSAYDIAVGFSEGSEPSEARQFAKNVIDKLKQRWRVHVVSPGQGAVPMKTCREGVTEPKEGSPFNRPDKRRVR